MNHRERTSDFPRVLSGALALSADDQQQLCAVLVRVAGGGATPSPAHAQEVPHPAEGESAEIGAAEWLKLIQAETPWARVQLLDDAVGRADHEDERAVLSTALNALLKEHPPLAVRRAVARVAVEHPIAICVGGTGLLLGLVAIGRGVIRLLF